ncbi:hypothetical protein GCM10009639_36230 [Kitasatospora putterlickiae]|uniref:Uncharacterized protein n=1 Tax=Kitasatospora putterlickiae TaxID=221725 RepID=A0ABN1Y7A5_9ACTN
MAAAIRGSTSRTTSSAERKAVLAAGVAAVCGCWAMAVSWWGGLGAQALGNCVVIRHGAASRWSIPSVRASRGPPESYQCRAVCGGGLTMRDGGGHDTPFVRFCPFYCYGGIAAE